MKDVCEIKCINEKLVKFTIKYLSKIDFSNSSEIFKTLGDKTRLKILYALSKNELCVCDLCTLLSMEQSAVSHQLKILRTMKLVNYRKEGKIVYYSLYDNHIINLIKMGVMHSAEK